MTESPMQRELASYLTTPERGDGLFTASITFPDDFSGFQGHFPGNPIVPAVCQISAIELLSRKCFFNDLLRIAKISAIKVRTPIRPGKTVSIRAKITRTPQPQIYAELETEDSPQNTSVKLLLEEEIHPLILKYYPEDTPLRRIIIKHSAQVRDKAFDILDAPSCPPVQIDRKLLNEGALLHDIGIGRCHAPKIECNGDQPYIKHGVLGAEMLRGISPDYEPLARICERHTGSGITAAQIIQRDLPLPHQDFLPETPEEKLVCLADKFFSKSGDMKEESLEQIRAELIRFGEDSLQRFNNLCQTFGV